MRDKRVSKCVSSCHALVLLNKCFQYYSFFKSLCVCFLSLPSCTCTLLHVTGEGAAVQITQARFPKLPNLYCHWVICKGKWKVIGAAAKAADLPEVWEGGGSVDAQIYNSVHRQPTCRELYLDFKTTHLLDILQSHFGLPPCFLDIGWPHWRGNRTVFNKFYSIRKFVKSKCLINISSSTYIFISLYYIYI